MWLSDNNSDLVKEIQVETCNKSCLIKSMLPVFFLMLIKIVSDHVELVTHLILHEGLSCNNSDHAERVNAKHAITGNITAWHVIHVGGYHVLATPQEFSRNY